jgi:NAD(P)-dependent dehydrogenase (short-subunit alcohol dehydrogenase family)
MSPAPVVLITGAGRGIGRGIALRLAAAGYSLIVNFRADQASALDTVRACEAKRIHEGQCFLPVQADVADDADRRRLLDATLSRAGSIDALVNNAGIAPRTRDDMLQTSVDSFEEVLRTNVTAPFFLSQLAANHWLSSGSPSLLPGGGFVIVFISSVSADIVSPSRPQYCIAKAGLAMASKLFAQRLAPHGVCAYELRPGIIETDMTAPVHARYDAFIATGGVPQRRWGTPDDVGRAVESLLAGHFPYSTGSVIAIDGGLSIQSL